MTETGLQTIDRNMTDNSRRPKKARNKTAVRKQVRRLTKRASASPPAVLLDREGVINRRIRNGYVTTWKRFAFLPGAMRAIRQLSTRGYRVLVVSNQAGVGKGLMSLQTLEEITRRFLSHVERAGGLISRVYYCTHRAEDGCDCRKPKPGLLLNAQAEFHFDPARTFMVGDTESDITAATRAGCKAILVSKSRKAIWHVWAHQPVTVVPDLLTAVAYIFAQSSGARK